MWSYGGAGRQLIRRY